MNHPAHGLGFLWRATSLRHAVRGWKHTLTVIAILALGVAAFLSIRLANRAAVVSFAGFSESISGGSDLTVTAPAGLLAADHLRELRLALGGQSAHLVPLLRASAAMPPGDGRAEFGRENFILLGLDLIGVQNLQADIGTDERLINLGGDAADFWSIIRNPQHLFVSEPLARRHRLEVGSRFPLIVTDRSIPFEIVGILPQARGDVPVPENLVVMDIAALQRLTGEEGLVSQVDLVLPHGPRHEADVQAAETVLASAADGRWVIRDPIVERGSGERMTAAFRMNLTILSLIALLVGAYLVTQALDAAVVRRRHEIAILRSLGLTTGELRRLWLVEILCLGVVGSALGIVLGWALAQVAVVAVAQTINALYQSSSAAAADLRGGDVAAGFGLGLVFSLLAGWLPLRDAAATPPAQVLSAGNWTPGLRLLRRPLLGWCLLLAGLGLSFLPPLTLAGGSRFPLAGHAAALLWLLGGTLAATSLFRPMAAVAMRVCANHPALHLGATRLRRASSRHRLAAAGLFVATAMAASMAVLVGSFDQTVRNWIGVRFQADVYLNSAGAQSADSRNRIRPETWRGLAEDPRVAAVDPFLALPIELGGISTFLAGSDLALVGNRQRLLWLTPPAAGLIESAPDADGAIPAIANEAFLERFGQAAGDIVEIPSPGGQRPLRIVAVQADYGNEQGMLLVDRRRLVEWFGIDSATNLTVFLHDPETVDAVVESWRAAHPGLSIRGNRELREIALTIFRQTFSITRALEWIGVLIALAGLALALTNILRESVRELATLRQLGMTRREIASATAVEGGGIALVGVTGGVILSVAIGYLLVFVINKQSFGWTLQFHIPAAKLFGLVVLVLVTGTATAYLAGRRAHRLLRHSPSP